MLLTVDVGNTNTVLGIFDDKEMVRSWRVKTDPRSTADELWLQYRGTSEALKRIADKTPHIQISESTRGILGQGQVDIQGLLLTLEELNYSGWIVVESFGMKLPAAHIWRKMFENERELIRESYRHLISIG